MAGNFPVPWLHDRTSHEIRSFISSMGHSANWGATTHQVHGSSWCDDNEANSPLWNSALPSILIGEIFFHGIIFQSLAKVVSFIQILVIQKWSQKSQTKHKIAMLGKRHFIWIGEHYQCHASATVCFHHGWDHLLQSFDAESQSLWGAALPKRPKRLPWWGKRWRMVEWQCRGPRVSHLLC